MVIDKVIVGRAKISMKSRLKRETFLIVSPKTLLPKFKTKIAAIEVNRQMEMMNKLLRILETRILSKLLSG